LGDGHGNDPLMGRPAKPGEVAKRHAHPI